MAQDLLCGLAHVMTAAFPNPYTPGISALDHSFTCHNIFVAMLHVMQAQQVMSWGAEGVIVGSALVKALGEAPTPEAGLQAMEALAQQLRDATCS